MDAFHEDVVRNCAESALKGFEDSALETHLAESNQRMNECLERRYLKAEYGKFQYSLKMQINLMLSELNTFYIDDNELNNSGLEQSITAF